MNSYRSNRYTDLIETLTGLNGVFSFRIKLVDKITKPPRRIKKKIHISVNLHSCVYVGTGIALRSSIFSSFCQLYNSEIITCVRNVIGYVEILTVDDEVGSRYKVIVWGFNI